MFKYWIGNDIDILIVIVMEKDGLFRWVNINEWVDNILFYEGFGGVNFNCRMFISLFFFYVSDFFVWDELICYLDLVEGLFYGSLMGCMLIFIYDLKFKEVVYWVFFNLAFI